MGYKVACFAFKWKYYYSWRDLALAKIGICQGFLIEIVQG